MRHLLILLALLFSFTAEAQLHFKTKDLKEVRQLADSIALTGKTPYKYTKEGVSRGDSNYYVVLYTNENDDFDRLGVAFWRSEKTYIFDFVAAKQTDLQAFWVKHFKEKKIKANQIQTGTIQNLYYLFQPNGGTWEIRRRIK